MGGDKLSLVGCLVSEPILDRSQARLFCRRLDEAAGPGEGGMRAVPRICIVYPGICLTTEDNHGKPNSGYTKGARLISAKRDSFSRLGHCGR